MQIEKILALIATHPKIRTVEIADLVDMEPEQVEPALQRYIAGGHILMTEVTAPNGRRVPAFEFSELFKDSETYRSAMAGIAIKERPQAIAHEITPLDTAPTGAEPVYREQTATGAIIRRDLPEYGPEANSASVSKPKPQMTYPETSIPANVPRITKLDMVLEYLRNQPGQRATTAEVRTVMDLAPNAHVNAYLSKALRTFKIHREGDIWSLYPIPKPAPVPAMEATPAPTIESAPPAVNVPPVPAPSEVPSPLSVALWSTGQFQINRGDQLVALLTQEESQAVFKYLLRYAVQVPA